MLPSLILPLCTWACNFLTLNTQPFIIYFVLERRGQVWFYQSCSPREPSTDLSHSPHLCPTPNPWRPWLVEMLTKWLTLSCPELRYLTGFQKVHLTVFPDSRPDLGFPKWERVQSSHPISPGACCGLLPLPFALEAG